MDHRIEVPKTITIDEVEYAVEDLSAQAKLLLEIHADWRRDLADVRLEVAKHEAALRNLEAEISETVKAGIAEAAANEAAVEEKPKAKRAKK